MSGKGDIENPLAFTSSTSTLGLGAVAAVTGKGDVVSDAPASTNPDDYVGSYTFTRGAATLSLGSVGTPKAQGAIDDVYGINDAEGVIAVAFSTVAPSLSLGSVAAPAGRGDIITPLAFNTVGNTIGGNSNVSNGHGDIPSPNSFITINPTLGTGTPTLEGPRGDIGELYIRVEGPVGQLVWQAGSPTLTPQTPAVPSGKGDFLGDQMSAGYGTISTTLVRNPQPPVLTFTISNATIHLTWTAWAPTAPAVPNIVYNLYRGVNGGAMTLYQTALATPNFDDTGMARGSTYQYFVTPVVPRTNAGTLQSNTVSVVGEIDNLYATPGTYTWTNLPGAYQIDTQVFGGGGGGGAGKYTDTGTFTAGQGGAGGGLSSVVNSSPSNYSSTVTVTVGAGGVGLAGNMAGRATDGGGSAFGGYFAAGGGQGGQGIQSAFNQSLGGVATSTISGAYTETGGGGGSTVTAQPPPGLPPFSYDGAATTHAPSGGGGGGSTDGTPLGKPTGNGGAITGEGVSPAAGGPGSFTYGINGVNGTAGVTGTNGAGGGGGGGGLFSGGQNPGMGAAGNGANGAGAGGGGGAGGACQANSAGGQSGGAGGNGASGRVKVVTWFW